jgi:orotidine-5'-phosphate decarboxylase
VTFIEKLNAAWSDSHSLLCVGLDPDVSRFPAYLKATPDPIFHFCKAVIDATADLVCAFKPQIAHFHAEGAEHELEAVCAYLKEAYPHIPLILDAKRGDVGTTAQQYAREVFERYGADAVTLSPFMGFDSIEPYLDYRDRGAIVLCRTSNPGGSDLQFLPVKHGDKAVPLYQHIAGLVADKWNINGQCALVVGATFPHEVAAVRRIVGDMPLLIPGIGAQGGDIGAVVRSGRTPDGRGAIINSSRAILYAGIADNEAFAAASRRVAIRTRDEINQHRA